MPGKVLSDLRLATLKEAQKRRRMREKAEREMRRQDLLPAVPIEALDCAIHGNLIDFWRRLIERLETDALNGDAAAQWFFLSDDSRYPQLCSLLGVDLEAARRAYTLKKMKVEVGLKVTYRAKRSVAYFARRVHEFGNAEVKR